MDFLWPRYMFELNKCKEFMFDCTEHWCKIWRKTAFGFQKWHEEFGKFSPEHWKVLKFELWWDFFIQSRSCMSLKFTGELFVMAMKIDSKLVEELACGIRIDRSTLLSSDLSTQKSQKLHFNGLPLTKVCSAWVKKVQRNYVWWHWTLIQNLKENWFWAV